MEKQKEQQKGRKDLIVFGYGLASLIPYLVLMNQMKPGFGWTVSGFILILVVLAKVGEGALRILSCIWIIAVTGYLAVFGAGAVRILFLSLTVLIWILAVFKQETLRPVYRIWMKAAHFLGVVISATIIAITFYFIFGLIGIVLRLAGKDMLDQKSDQKKTSHWIKRENHSFEPDSYRRQY